ncbi:hypothetical protein Tsubulata_019815 [Turnera subulata]|uniref:UPF3 domain-containing protein n=1 Tax=Turnera subulata TaxID=218843 RepID=A0A9Q0JPQ5_9ROSI|nr:hypothetical protein Tsubulata_019815 [Turnera subulata]
MKRTKVVIRHLPPSLSQSNLFSQFDHLFSDRYNWFCFRPGKSSLKHQKYSRAYIDFKSPEDVLEFAGFFNGHFKAIVEYAPSQHIPNLCNKRDSREGTIYEGASKETPITTPLMEFVRQKRAAEGGNQDLPISVKVRRRTSSAAVTKSSAKSTKRRSEKKKYVLKEKTKKEKKKKPDLPPSSGKEMSKTESVRSMLILERKEFCFVPQSMLEQSSPASASGHSSTSVTPKQKQQREAGERLIKAFLLNSGAHQNKSLESVKSQQKFQNVNLEKGRKSCQATNAPADLIGCGTDNKPLTLVSNADAQRTTDDKFIERDSRDFSSLDDKRKKHTRNKDRPDRIVQTLQKSIVQNQHLSSIACEHAEFHSESAGGSSPDVAVHNKKGDGIVSKTKGRSSKRGGAAGYTGHEKHMWVQKSTSGS